MRALTAESRAGAERFFGQARLMVADKEQRLLEYEHWQAEQESVRLRELGTTLTTVTDLDVLAYLEQHYRHQISRRQVAEAAGVSEDHLSRLFHRQLGLPLWDYLIRLRIQRAKERLRQSDDSVQTVARAVGFHDRAYFSRVLRKVTGMAPHTYRKTSARA